MSAETRALMVKLGLIQTESSSSEDDLLDGQIRIFYCSRTHSQLSQFVSEARKIHLSPVISADPDVQPGTGCAGGTTTTTADTVLEESLKHLTLGSRKNLCVHPKVRKLTNLTAMNERCLEIQKSGTPKDDKCSFLPTKDAAGDESVANFRQHVFSSIKDIEDLGKLGERLGVCPYYASRGAVTSAELVTLPYPLLLQKSSREALNLSLKDSVVIIDEAHNLMDAINNVYSASITLGQVERSREQLKMYVQKFGKRLNGKNRVYVTQTVRVINSVHACLRRVLAQAGTAADGVIQLSDLLSGDGVDQINLFKLSQFLNESKLARKIDGYAR